MISPQLPHLFFGGDYNPDQWPESVWPEDVRLMQEAGVNLVSLPIFSWAKLEPKRGEYEWGWFDRILDLLHAGGIKVDLATATASPPHWLVLEHPDILPVDRDGLTLHPNSRQHYCPNSEAYRERAAALVRAMAERYGKHPAVIMWHLNNEYACHVTACYCDTCAGAFRRWLQGRYPGGLDEINERWGTAFWSQWFYAWEEVQPPRKAPTIVNPGLTLDYRRFMSDTFVDLARMEKRIVREVTPDLPVTTNYPGITGAYDGFDMMGEMDFASYDSYPDVGAPERTLAERDEVAYWRGDFDAQNNPGCDAGYWRAGAAFSLDVTRATGGYKPWVLMEQVTTHVNWRPVNAAKRPGEMRRWSYQAVARGADGVLFFQWRASRAGAEKFHGAMVPHLGPEGRAYQEVKALGNELKRLDVLAGSRVPAQVGVILDWPTWWAANAESKPGKMDYFLTVQRYHRALYERNVATDIVRAGADWLAAGLRVVVAPLAYIATDATATNVRRFVEGGGIFLTSYFSGIVDENDRIHLGGYPHPVLREVLGLVVEEFAPQYPAVNLRLRSETDVFSGGKPRGSRWADLIQLRGADVLATFRDEWFAGRPAVTRHGFGKGAAYYVGTELDFAALDDLLAAVCREADVLAPVKAPPGVEAVVRRAENGAEFLFLLNASGEPATVGLRTWRGAADLLGGNRPDREITLPAEGVAILQR